MNDDDDEGSEWLAKRFDADRARLRAVAYRMLGSSGDADDAVQEAWLKVARAGAGGVDNLGGWLTTVVARVCLDMLRSRKSRREEPLGLDASAHEPPRVDAKLALADAIGPAVLIVLEQLTPPERVAFVLHDMFDLSFDEIAPIVDRTPAAARQLASRARRRVRGQDAPFVDVERQRDIVNAFLAASRDGDIPKLLAVLAPDAVMRADPSAVTTAAANRWAAAAGALALVPEARGAAAVADTMRGRARGVTAALVDGAPGAVWLVDGAVRSAFLFTIDDETGCIDGIELVMEPARLAELTVTAAVG